MTALYKLTAQHQRLQDLADGAPEDMLTSLSDTFEAIEGEYQDKALALVTLINNMDSDSAAIDAEIARLQARKKTIKNKQTGMRDYLRDNMEASGITNIKCPLFSITLAKGRDVVSVDCENLIPAEYMAVKVSKSPDKAAILKALKTGEVIPGATITKSSPSLRIK